MAGIVMVSKEDEDREKASEDAGKKRTGNTLLYYALAIFAGVACAVQIAVNGALGGVIGSSGKATFISVSSGFFNTLFIMIAIMLVRGRKGIYTSNEPGGQIREIPRFRFEWLMLFGGPLACVVVGSNASAAPVLGTNPVVILNLTGMMATGLIVDATGFLGIDVKPVTRIKLAGMLVMMAGAVMITLL